MAEAERQAEEGTCSGPGCFANRACFLGSGGQDDLDHVLKPWSNPCFLVFSASAPLYWLCLPPLKPSASPGSGWGSPAAEMDSYSLTSQRKISSVFCPRAPQIHFAKLPASGEQETVRANPVTMLPGLMLPHRSCMESHPEGITCIHVAAKPNVIVGLRVKVLARTQEGVNVFLPGQKSQSTCLVLEFQNSSVFLSYSVWGVP